MKITCPYCGTLYNDTMSHCPSCGAVNAGVVRTASDQPLTVEELKKWYSDRGLPPYRTTRFFIGEDCREARAFGIYKDTHTGNFIVYKNKDNGSRAIRYEGTDEAYAVNELYQRLKQEIIQQKHRQSLKESGALTDSPPGRRRPGKSLRKPHSSILKFLLALVLFPIACFALIILIGVVVILVEDTPKDGYYRYNNAIYYHYEHSEPYGQTDWFLFDDREQDWSEALSTNVLPEELERNKQAKEYYLSEEAPSELKEHSFTDSLVYKDIQAGNLDSGYYSYNNTTYYHLDPNDALSWYYYDKEDDYWYETDSLPEELTHNSIAEDFYYTPVWDSQTQLTDFTDTEYYQEYEESQKSNSDKWDNDNDDSDYDWNSDSSWDSSSSDWDSDW